MKRSFRPECCLLTKLRSTSRSRGLLKWPLTAVKMDSDSDYEAFGGFSTAEILDTNSDIDDLSGSDSDSDSNADLFGSDSDGDQVVWTDVLGDVNMLPFREPVCPRHSLTEDPQAIDFLSTDRATIC